jgi:hypothetical protein
LELKVILDKSSFHGLSASELERLRGYFAETITPVLIYEVLGDLTSKAKRTKAPRDKVAELSGKLSSSLGTVNENHHRACLASLLGTRFPDWHAPLPDNYFIAQSGGMIVEKSPLQDALGRWAHGEINETEAEISALWRRATTTLSLGDFTRRLLREQVLLPRPDGVSDVVASADVILARGGLQQVLLSWLLDHVSPDELNQSALLERWRRAGSPPLAHYAPYAFHCVRVLLSLAIAVRHKFIKWESTHAVDAQYLFYLPFCEVFVSEDHVHRLLAPQLMDNDQTFVRHAELKAALKKLVAADAEAGSAIGPGTTFLDKLWEKHRGKPCPRP